ncbi:MAG TPA: Hsp20/alpha crystallin family protein [Nitrospirota bacterium]
MAVKKYGLTVRLMGEELARLMKAVELREKSSMVLGDTGGPLMDLYETAGAIVIEADLPGMDPDDVEISILGGTITIEGVMRERINEAEKINFLCMERSFENFRRLIKLSVPINPREAKAVYDRGVLTLTIPKIKDKRGVVVKVKVGREKD